MGDLRLKIRDFKKTKAYAYYKEYVDRQNCLGHNKLGIAFKEGRYSNL